MRVVWWSLASLLFLATVAAADPAGLGWTTWFEDDVGEDVSTPPQADLHRFFVAVHEGQLHLRVQNAGAPVADPTTATHFDLELRAPDPLPIRIRADHGGVHASVRGHDAHSGAWGVAPDAAPWDFHLWFELERLAPGAMQNGFTLGSPEAETYELFTNGWDRASGPPLRFVAEDGNVTGIALATTLEWVEVEGPDLAGGAGVAANGEAAVLSYYVYNDTRGTDSGLWAAAVSPEGTWTAQRIGDYSPLPGHRDASTRTEVAVANGRVHVLYAPCPGQDCGTKWRLLSGEVDAGGLLAGPTAWTASRPGAGVDAVATPNDKADVAAHGERVVVALPLEGGRLAVLARDGVGPWARLAVFEDARLPKLDLDEEGRAHVAFFRPGPDPEHGPLVHASETAGWSEQEIVQGLEDRSRGTTEDDGSFAFALDGQGRPAFVWDVSRAPGTLADAWPERGYGHLDNGRLVHEPAPIEPGHGNIQLSIRLAFDEAGNAHVGSGYGSTDTYARRTPAGTWHALPIDRHDVWDLAVTPGGMPVFGYTQPHGGTTVAASFGQGSFAGDLHVAGPDVVAAVGDEDVPAWPLVVVAGAVLAALRRR